MARALISDPFHAFRFHVKVTSVNGRPALGDVTAGFTNVTLPTQSVESAEYKEGIWVYRRKFPGDPTFDDITFSRGVTTAGTEFWSWINETARSLEYRADLEIHHFHRSDVPEQVDFSGLTGSRVIKVYEAFPISVKPGSDMDSVSSEISLQEITLSLERFEVINNKA
jgi:phage tail-like protein